MSKYELSLSPDYVADWKLEDAVRELFQNALDQETVQQNNQMFFDYDGKDVLRIGNKSSILEAKTLLLGTSTKRNDKSTIGKFGEGYKIAALVLARLGKKTIFYNYGAQEIWYPRLVNSRRYDSLILTFFVEKKHIWHFIPDNNLTIAVHGITPNEYERIVDSNLHLQGNVDVVHHTPYGRILGKEYSGKLFVDGLYVCNFDDFTYGYDILPEHLELGRDRKLIREFDLKWLTSRMWSTTGSAQITTMAKDGASDTEYVTNVYEYSARKEEIFENAFDEFVEEYGEDAVPVTSQMDLKDVPSSYKAVVVPSQYKQLITNSKRYKAPEKDVTKAVSYRLATWFEKIQDLCNDEAKEEFENLMNEIVDLEQKTVRVF